MDSLTLCLLTFVIFFGALVGWYGRPMIYDTFNQTQTVHEDGSSMTIDHGLLAIAITYCIQLSGVFQYTVRLSAKVETYLVAVERLSHLTNLETEYTDDMSRKPLPDTTELEQVGQISFDNVHVRYEKIYPAC